MCVAAADSTSVCRNVDLPVCGAPPMAMLPPADDDVDAPHLLAVPARLVHDAEPEPQRLALMVALDEFVDRSRIGQRRQPHPVRADLTGGQLVEDDLAQHPLFGFDCS